MHPWQSPNVPTQDAIERKNEGRQRSYPPILCPGSIHRIAPQWVIIPNAMRIVAHVVACRLVAPRFKRVLNGHPDQLSQGFEGFISNQGKTLLGFCHTSSLSEKFVRIL